MKALPWLAAISAVLLPARLASAQMVPLQDLRAINANVNYNGQQAHEVASPAGAFASFDVFLQALVESKAGSCDATAFQNSQFYPAGINFSGGSEGSYTNPSGSYDALSLAKFRVRIDSCLDYSFYGQVDAGDVANAGWVEVRSASGTSLIRVTAGSLTVDGRLGPGEYIFEGRSAIASSTPRVQGPTYAMIWTCQQCSSSLINAGPGDLAVRCDTVATFCVVPAGPVGSFTYQWRRNYVPLTNNGHYAGVTTPCLTIQNACWYDVASYDVVVSNGAIAEPSRPAQLSITTTPVAVEPGAAAWTLGRATPNPFGVATSCHYEAPRPFAARVAIFDAAGRRVRQLVNGVLAASGTLTWDGRTDSGAPAVPGVYFLQLEGGPAKDVRRIALVR